MPIDLKWVRNDPDRVRQFQALRRRPRTGDGDRQETKNGGGNDNDGSGGGDNDDTVDLVLRTDELARKHLQSLQDSKRSLKQLQILLRPNKNNNKNNNNNSSSSAEDRQSLLEEKKLLESTIQRAETVWKLSLKETQSALCKLASPVTIGNHNDNHNDHDNDNPSESFRRGVAVAPPPCFSRRKRLGNELEHAWKDYTMRYFAHYVGVELPRGMRVEVEEHAKRTGGVSLSPERAHELWGCSCSPEKEEREMDGAAFSSTLGTPRSKKCPICRVLEFGKESALALASSSLSEPDGRYPVVVLPSWIHLLTECLPNKSIWGERELPRCSALWGSNEDGIPPASDGVHWLGRLEDSCFDEDEDENKNKNNQEDLDQTATKSSASGFSLELVAISAPSVVDAREIQTKMVDELGAYYGSLLAGESNGTRALERVFVAPHELHHHEWSRVELHLPIVDEDPSRTLRLGWVSHWGDASTRACNMAFAGGGVVRAGGKKSRGKSNNKSNTNNNKNKNNNNSAATKEYVHLIQASVVDGATWNKILCANSSSLAAAAAAAAAVVTKEPVVSVPPSLVPHLVRPLPPRIVLCDLVLPDAGTQKPKISKDAFFGRMTDDTQKGGEARGVVRSETDRAEAPAGVAEDSGNRPRFPPASRTPFCSKDQLQQQIRWEKLSCPYDFVFGG
eukprot:CAMPEP_0172387802 /NCGR_PEP_ID=MMETSP1061-20121228/5044_1 /TAXON_ID=37318 /ORGANISM="Pseudo-nitzschia pungens, Strain cf. pungens" /LENGTH=676 /DNA_ID=CAMNT_0013117545 /DNA_START=336 /DNA_END=2366 /DNA_ORIENTATION=+